MANPNLVKKYEQAAQDIQHAVGDMVVEMERLTDINKYLSEKLTNSHQFHGALIRERDGYQVKYEVLRDICLSLCALWGNGNDEERLQQRMKEVLGLTAEEESQTHDYQTGWAEDGPVPDGEDDF